MQSLLLQQSERRQLHGVQRSKGPAQGHAGNEVHCWYVSLGPQRHAVCRHCFPSHVMRGSRFLRHRYADMT